VSGLIAVAGLVGVLALLNLLLTFGVIRRLREHEDLLARGAGPGGAAPSLPVNQRIADFDGSTTDGEAVARELLAGDTLVGFLTPGCGPCQKRLPELVETARVWPGGRRDTFMVVVGERADAVEYIQALASVAKVVVEAPNGPIAAAFGVAAFPIFGVVDSSGRVLRSEMDPAALRLQGAASR
jgi:thiol-disulfide isomerase/thioredoxin